MWSLFKFTSHIAFLLSLLFGLLAKSSYGRPIGLNLPSSYSKNAERVSDGDSFETASFGHSNDAPLIGILSQPGDGADHEVPTDGRTSVGRTYNTSYIAASYVKFVEMAGARAVPILFDDPTDVLQRKFKAINGIIFPGGGTPLVPSLYTSTAETLFKMALDENDRGDYFFVHGTCLGFELLSIIVSKDHDILQDFTANGIPGPLHFVDEDAKDRAFFRGMSQDLIDKVRVQNLAMENHERGIAPERLFRTRALHDFFRVLTTTPDKEGKVYVSSVEGRNYPVYGTQWHPEKNPFEFGIPNVPHSQDAVRLTQAVANFLVQEARRSRHQPASHSELMDLLIYNYAPVYTGKVGSDMEAVFDQAYVFPMRK